MARASGGECIPTARAGSPTASSYRRAFVEAGFSTVELDPVQRVSAEEIRRERLALAPEFQQWSDEDLATRASGTDGPQGDGLRTCGSRASR